MSRKLITLATLLSTMLVGCSTTQPTAVSVAPQAAVSPVQAVPCPSDPVITYHAPKTEAQATAWLKGDLADPTNHFDTAETVAAIRRHNAVVSAVCTVPK